MNPESRRTPYIWKPLFIGGAAVFLYAGVLVKLTRDWWTDENYSHGLLVPVVIAFILLREISKLRLARQAPSANYGIPLLLIALALLFAGTLGAELYLQRISLVVFLSALIICFFGRRLLWNLWVPLVLLLLSIPVPQLLFNKVAFPLQLWASRLAEVCMSLVGIPAIRNGNIIELVPLGTTQVAALEVVEACSGIRSLMTLAALAVLLAYFTRSGRADVIGSPRELLRDPLVWRAFVLVLLAVPIALVTNALRVAGTGVVTYLYGVETAEGAWHDLSGFGVFVIAFILLAISNFVLLRCFPKSRSAPNTPVVHHPPAPQQLVLTVFIMVLSAGVMINWLDQRGEVAMERRSLSRFPIYLDGTTMTGIESRFPEATEKVLGASDYVMRDYRSPAGQKLNLYIGYYRSQRTGTTYHSPRNCLPGTGWEMKELDPVEITTADGGTFTANKYMVKRGDYRGLMIYWYQGRGRTNSSEYWDKLGTIADSVLKNRSDGAMVRIMTQVGSDERAALEEAVSFSSIVAARLPLYVPN